MRRWLSIATFSLILLALPVWAQRRGGSGGGGAHFASRSGSAVHSSGMHSSGVLSSGGRSSGSFRGGSFSRRWDIRIRPGNRYYNQGGTYGRRGYYPYYPYAGYYPYGYYGWYDNSLAYNTDNEDQDSYAGASYPAPYPENDSAPLGITTTTAQLPTGVTGTAYPSTTLQASGGVTPYTWSYTGSLPTGLNLSASGGITGTPTATGTFNFTVKVTDSTKPTANTKTASLSITVDTPITVTTTSPLPTGYVGLAYSQTLAATGGSGKGYTWAVTSGSTLPAGLNLSAAGVLSGKPTTVGNPSFSVK